MLTSRQPAAQQPHPKVRVRPLYTVGAARALLGVDEDDVLHAVEDGYLLFAWDLSLSGPNGRRAKDLRILPAALDSYKAGQVCQLEFPQVVTMVLPHHRPLLTAREIRLVLNLSSTHVINLIRYKLLMACSLPHRGPYGSPKVTASSFVNLLRTRRWPVPELDKA